MTSALRSRHVARAALILALALLAALPASALTLIGTTGDDEDPSTLVEIDPATGNIVRTIGDIGYTINGLAYDAANGILYATTAFESSIQNNALVTLDMTTGVATQVAAGAGRYVNLPTLAPNGTLYAWSQGPQTPNRLVTIDKTTGIATIVGNPQLTTFTHTLQFDKAGALRLLNGDGNLYVLNPANAAATFQGHVDGLPNGYAHHGVIHPQTGLLHALTAKEGNPSPNLAVIDLATRNVVSMVPIGIEVHTIAWVDLPSRLTVTKSGSGSGSVSSSDTHVDCGATCSHAYKSGAAVTLSATADPGSVFTGWLGACTGTGPCTPNLATDATVIATFATPANVADHPLDLDNNGARDALTDGLMLIRRMFGLSGAAMTSGATGSNAQRTDAAAIAGFIGDVNPKFDVDGNGRIDALTDGILVLRYLFGLRGTALVSGAIGAGATRTTIVAIESYLQSISQ